MPTGYARAANAEQAKGLLDVMNVTKPSFWGLLGQNVQGMGQGLLDALMAPGNALAGQYDQYYDPSSGQTTYGRNGNPYAMMGDASNLSGMVTLGAGAVPRAPGALDMGIRAYHGTPHSFDKFDISKIGTGEGAQAYGHGLYFAENQGVAKGYQKTLAGETFVTPDGMQFNPDSLGHLNVRTMARRGDLDGAIAKARELLKSQPQNKAMLEADLAKLQDIKARGGLQTNPGSLYEVDINAEPHDFLDWDKPLSEQPQALKMKLAAMYNWPTTVKQVDGGKWVMARADGSVSGPKSGWPDKASAEAALQQRINDDLPKMSGAEFYRSVETTEPGRATVLRGAGVQGIRYLDAGSRGAGDGSRNYVVFHHDPVTITGKLST